jgi:hypothetical protein
VTSQNVVELGDYQVDREVDFANQDQAGCIWAWVDAARDPFQIVPGAVLTFA